MATLRQRLMNRLRYLIDLALAGPAKNRVLAGRRPSLNREKTPCPRVAILIVSYGQLRRLRQCLESIWEHTQYPNYQLVVVDNGSTAEVVDYLNACREADPDLRLQLNADNRGFPAACNQARALAADAEAFVYLNNDTVVSPGWLEGLLRHLQDQTIGLVGVSTNAIANQAMIDAPYLRLSAMPRFACSLRERYAGQWEEAEMVALFCAAIRREVLDRVGPLDERFGIGMFEDDDLCRRVRAAGYRVGIARDVYVHHWGQASFRRLTGREYLALYRKNEALYREKWGEVRPLSEPVKHA